MKKNILLLETIADEAYQILTEAADIEIFEAYKTPATQEILKNMDAIITRGIGQVNNQLMDACPKLKVVARCGVGLDNIDVKGATQRKIKVVNAPNSNAKTVAEHTIALILMLQRNLYEAIQDVKNGNWAARNTFKSDEVGGKTIGILGLGNIGMKVAKIAQALGMNVVYWSKSKKDVDYQYLTKEEIFRKSDIISIHLPFNTETENLINAETLKIMKPNAILINTARHQIVNKNALMEALNTEKLAGYGADVPISPIPDKDDALITHPKVLMTAHVSSLTASTYRYMCLTTVNNVLAILRGQAPQENCIFNLKELS
jgi:D-3-phosphoglycerate dehydrogenase